MSEQMIDHKEPHNPYALIQAENAAMMDHIIKLQLVMDVQLKALKQQAADIAALRDALKAAATSLQSIANQAGKDEYMDTFLNVRGYARNRSIVAFEALGEVKE